MFPFLLWLGQHFNTRFSRTTQPFRISFSWWYDLDIEQSFGAKSRHHGNFGVEVYMVVIFILWQICFNLKREQIIWTLNINAWYFFVVAKNPEMGYFPKKMASFSFPSTNWSFLFPPNVSFYVIKTKRGLLSI